MSSLGFFRRLSDFPAKVTELLTIGGLIRRICFATFKNKKKCMNAYK